jgi:nitrogen regulatory protein PII
MVLTRDLQEKIEENKEQARIISNLEMEARVFTEASNERIADLGRSVAKGIFGIGKILTTPIEFAMNLKK